ncbi:arginine utilization regulatory protein [Dethiosulfatibacter aminovorans DSM 17477]|uniref:Arginine utilization regulatory protein n=1 Tax=Dethiosulfatibacter aminovorans DSM 17477 TaxID=1121476 RepID=A0A1M6EB15_9FIRM|nr:sigma 54-interacting transcriptional regulator [Dethiosulfatibacter aminovorans]SHI82704.1 arginine utilization regulatory protein [Dethiosulfatibacter aminovorans DSM 17477]
MENKYYESVIEILDYIDEGIQVIDEHGKIVYYNKAARVVDGIEGQTAIGRHFLEIYPSLSNETSTLIKSMETMKAIYNEQQDFINYKGDKITTMNSSFPIKHNNRIIGAIEVSKNITQMKEMSEKIADLQSELYKPRKEKRNIRHSEKYTLVDIIGQSKEMLKLKNLAFKASQSDSPVLIGGKTGTGKELFVQAIHYASRRKKKPFIAQNCAALPANLLESMLFGSVRGSFTGAENRPGLFEMADGGTLFLDEINSMPLELQAKLLRAIQNNNIRRVGATSTIDVNVRIIAAFNEDIEDILNSGKMRKDLFYRLNVITLIVPELKDRSSDIPLLVEYFIDKYNKEMNKYITGLSDEVMEIFMHYDWPGNVRELEHAIEGIASIYDIDLIREEHLPYQFRHIKDSEDYIRIEEIGSLKKTLEDTEKKMIELALKKTDNNITRSAEILDVPRQTLQYRIKKLKIINT